MSMELANTYTDKLIPLAKSRHSVATLKEKADAVKTLGAKDIDMAKIDEAAQEFEAVFLTEMLRPMFAEINKPDPLFGGGKGEEIFSNMMLDEYGRQMAAQGGIGLAAFVKAEMIRLQEAVNGQ